MKRPLGIRLQRAAIALAPEPVARALRELLGAGPASRRGASLSYAPAYRGASIHQMNDDWIPGVLSGDSELRDSLSLMRRRGRDLRRNNPYARQFLRLAGTNVVGPYGFTSRPQVRDADGELDRDVNGPLRAWFREFTRSRVTLDRRLDLVRAELLALDTMLTEGECFVRMVLGAPGPHGLALQFIDADLIDERYSRLARPGENEIRMGVEVDEFGGPVGYWVNRPESDWTYPGGERYFVPAWNPHTGTGEMLHLMMPARVNQTRGVTIFHAAMELLNQIGAYGEAETYHARAGATTLGFIIPGENAEEPDDAEEDEGQDVAPDAEPAGRPARATRPESIVNEPLAWHRLHRGETVEQFKTEHPNAVVPAFTKLMLQGTASGYGGLYYEVANDYEGVNYTSSRAGQLTQQDVWRLLQEDVIQDLHAPVYYTALRLALLRGAIPLPGGRRARPVQSYAAVDHRGRGWTTMNTLQDSQNHALRLACGMRSRHQVMAEDNEDFEETLEELAAEERAAARLGVSIAPPGSLAADIAAELARQEEQRNREEATPGAKGNGNGADGNRNGSQSALSVPARAPRAVARRF